MGFTVGMARSSNTGFINSMARSRVMGFKERVACTISPGFNLHLARSSNTGFIRLMARISLMGLKPAVARKGILGLIFSMAITSQITPSDSGQSTFHLLL